MSARRKHRVDALRRRAARIEAGLPADSSNRVRVAKRVFGCSGCDKVFWRAWQYAMHAQLRGCSRATAESVNA